MTKDIKLDITAKIDPLVKQKLTELESQNKTLKKIVVDFHWMARRYADGRQTYAVGMFNEHTRSLLALGVRLNPTSDEIIWARDGSGKSSRRYDALTDVQATPGTPEAKGQQ